MRMSAVNNEKNLTTEAWIVNATTRKASGYLFAAAPLIAKNLARKGPARFPDAAYWSIDGKSCFVIGSTGHNFTFTFSGFHYRSQYFIFKEEHVLPGVELEAEVEYDRNGKVTAFLMGLEFTSEEKIRFVRI